MSNFNRENIDRKTNKPNPKHTEGLANDRILNRAEQTRRDSDVIKTPKRTPYDIDYAIKWYIENEIRPQVTDNGQVLTVPVIFANGEKWDNVRRLGYLRDEKGMLQSPIIMLKRNSIVERDMVKGLDVNHTQPGSHLIYRSKYNSRNRFEDSIFPIPTNQPASSEQLYVIDIPKYVTIEYDIMLWCDFTTQMNELVDQIMPYGRFAWGNETNKFPTTLGQFSFETVNTIGEDRLVRSTNTLTVQGTLLSEQETRINTLKTMYSVKKVSFDQVIDVGVDLFNTTTVPVQLLQVQSRIVSGGSVVATGGGSTNTINATTMLYLTVLTEKQATRVNTTTVTIAGTPKINPVTLVTATGNEFDLFINGQYIDKQCYTWTPTDTLATQTIVFDTVALGYTIDVTDLIIVKGRWA
jgi:hypothetical protein